MTRTKILSLLLAAAAAVVLAACGGGDNQATAASQPAMTTSGTAATVGVTDNGDLGKILVDSKGRTVYLFKKDTGPQSTCFGACATDWPPVTTTAKPTAGKGLTASMLGTTKRSDGRTQVTYNGHPLYLYIGDQSAGDTNGQGLNFFGAVWYVVSPAGSPVTSQGSSSGGGASPY
jgi:predicted lipoprotein with Yx(FWY)xxD motif